jgi:hypothetical protein
MEPERAGDAAGWRDAIKRCRAKADTVGGWRRWLGLVPPRGANPPRILWGHPIKANHAAFVAGRRSEELPGVCVYATDDAGDAQVENLADVARYLSELRSAAIPADPQLRRVQEVISNDFKPFKPLTLPAQVTGGRPMIMAITFYDRGRLPIGRLIKAPFPLITPGGLRADPLVLPLDCWAAELVSSWRDAAGRVGEPFHDFVRLQLPATR